MGISVYQWLFGFGVLQTTIGVLSLVIPQNFLGYLGAFNIDGGFIASWEFSAVPIIALGVFYLCASSGALVEGIQATRIGMLAEGLWTLVWFTGMEGIFPSWSIGQALIFHAGGIICHAYFHHKLMMEKRKEKDL